MCDGILLSHKKQNEIMLFAATWMHREIRILSEESQRSSCCGAAEMNPTRNHEVAGLIPAVPKWVKDLALP